MGSVITPLPDIYDQGSLFGSQPSTVFMQFVPGKVVDVATSSRSGIARGDKRKTNSILAKVHYGNKLRVSGLMDESDRYFPLLRGVIDVPAKGDPVLLCTIGPRQYYLGPLNTDNNPNFNYDNHDSLLEDRFDYDTPARTSDALGVSANFKFDKNARYLEKPYKDGLDDVESGPQKNKNVRDIHGDMYLEGRHGNSIRIGSRANDPYIMIANGRFTPVPFEQLSGASKTGTLLSITKRGTFNEHFGVPEDMFRGWSGKSFVFATEERPERDANDRIIFGDMFNIFEKDSGTKAPDWLYDYNKHQTLLNTGKLSLNAYDHGMTLTAKGHILLGSKKNIVLGANKDIIIDAPTIYIGQRSFEKRENNTAQGMVHGENLRAVLEHMVDLLSGLNCLCTGAPAPMVYNGDISGALYATEVNKLKMALSKGDNTIVSERYFIDNDREYQRR